MHFGTAHRFDLHQTSPETNPRRCSCRRGSSSPELAKSNQASVLPAKKEPAAANSEPAPYLHKAFHALHLKGLALASHDPQSSSDNSSSSSSSDSIPLHRPAAYRACYQEKELSFVSTSLSPRRLSPTPAFIPQPPTSRQSHPWFGRIDACLSTLGAITCNPARFSVLVLGPQTSGFGSR